MRQVPSRLLRLCQPLLASIILLFPPTGAVTAAHADDDAALCAAVQNLATSTNQVMAGKTLTVPGIIFDSFNVDCDKRIIGFVTSVPLKGHTQGTYAWSVAQRQIDNGYCPNAIWRGIMDKGWRIETTLRFTDHTERTLAVNCSGMAEPVVPRAVPPSMPGVVDRSGQSAQTAAPPPTSTATAAPADQSGEQAADGAMKTSTEHTAIDAAGNPVVVYETTGLNPDCSRTGAIVIRVVKPPAHGSLKVADASVFPHYPPANVRSVCNSRSVPGYRVTYQSRKGYSGADSAELQVFFPAGRALDVTTPIEVK